MHALLDSVEVSECDAIGINVALYGVLEARGVRVRKCGGPGIQLDAVQWLPVSSFEDCSVDRAEVTMPVLSFLRTGAGKSDKEIAVEMPGIEVTGADETETGDLFSKLQSSLSQLE